MLLFLGAFLVFIGFLDTLPWSVNPSAPRPERRWYDDMTGAEPVGYLTMLLGGFLVVFGIVVLGVVALLAGGLAEPDDPPLGVLLMFVGAAGIWSWFYDSLYQRLRRTQPTARWTRLIGALGRAGKRVGPAVFVVGVVVTIAL